MHSVRFGDGATIPKRQVTQRLKHAELFFFLLLVLLFGHAERVSVNRSGLIYGLYFFNFCFIKSIQIKLNRAT